MRKGALIGIVAAAVVIVAAAGWFGVGYGLTRGVGAVVSEERVVGDFRKIDVEGEGSLVITEGDVTQVRIDAPRNILDRLLTRVEGDTLHIRPKRSWLWLGLLPGGDNIVYQVTIPRLAAVEVSGAIEVRSLTELDTDQLLVRSSGSCTIELNVRVDEVELDASGSTDVVLRGAATSLTLNSSGSTKIEARALVTETASIDCSGSSVIDVNVNRELRVKASGSSVVSYIGRPRVTQQISGSGEVRQLQ